MFEVRRNRERIHSRIGKLFGEDTRKSRAKSLASHPARWARIIPPHKFKAAWFCFSKSLYFEDDAVGLALLDAQQPPCQVAFLRPQMDEWIFSLVMNFAMQPGEFGQPFAIFADLDRARSGQFAERAFN